MRRTHRTDTTQTAIVAALRGVGCRVWIVGAEIDLVCWFRGTVYLIDTKGKGGRMTARQKTLVADGFPIHFPTTAEEALAVVGAVAYGVEDKR